MLPFTDKLRNLSIFITFALCSAVSAVAQTEEWFSSDGYLSSSLINSVLYDRNGMLWVTTDDCLNRFDGSKFTIYRHDPDSPGSIANNRVNSLFEDQDGRLFVCTHAGVQLYDLASDSFSEPLHVVEGDAQSSPLSAMVQRSDGQLWAVGNEVYRVVLDSGKPALEHIDLPESVRFIYTGVVDHDDNIWLSKRTEGVFRISPDGQVKHFLGNADDQVILSMAVADDGTLYAGSAKRGFYRYQPESETFERIPLGGKFDNYIISSIYPDEFGNILIGTDGAGLLMYNPKRNSTMLMPLVNVDYDKIKVHGLTKDTFGNLWVGVYQKGLVKKPKLSPFFQSIDQRNSDLVGTCCVTAVYRDKDGTLWVGTDNDDVYAVDLSNRTSQHFSIDVPASVMCLYEDSKERLWIGSYNRGAGRLEKRTGKYTPMTLKHKTPGGYVDVSHVYDFVELPDGDLLVATMGAGLFRYKPETDTGTKIQFPELSDWITSVKIDPVDGRVLLGTYDGFFTVTPDFKDIKHVLARHIVSDIHVEPDHDDIWLGTNEGLVRLDRALNVKQVYTQADGLPSQWVLAIVHGDQDLWLSTPHGLCKFNVAKGEFSNFSVADGLPNNEFSRNSAFRDSSGNIYFGGNNGVTIFRDTDVEVEGQKLTPRITDFFIGDESVNSISRSGCRQIVDCSITDAKTIHLSHHDNSFTIRINTKEFVNSSQVIYYYKFDREDWVRLVPTAGSLGAVTITFTNVASGSHTLQFKAIYGGVESDTKTVKIDVAYVWYATWWAKLIYLILALCAIYAVYRVIHDRMVRRRIAQEQKHKSEILESKLQFFTNISHEIRTPLSLVIGPLQKLQTSDTDQKRSDTYQVVLRNAYRILRLVNELMDLRKIDNNQMRMHYSEVNICDFVHDLYETFSHSAKAKDIDFTFTHPGCDDLKAWVDTSNFDKVIMNLLSNAMKFTPDHGKININISQGENPEVEGPLAHYIEIAVTDSGIGISEEERKYVFHRFFQASNNKAGGTGIGLHLTRELVELHQGTIEVTDNPDGQGTRFVVRIPADNEHMDPQSIVPTAPTPSADTISHSTEVTAAPAVDIPVSSTPEPEKPRGPKGHEIVYVVEDDEEIREYLIANLGQYYHTYGFSNGRLALDAIHERQPSLVITDVMMPEMDGYTLTKKIKQNINLNHIPVIILTAKTREEDNIEAIDSGAAVYISKPFNIDVVIRTARNIIDSLARMRNAIAGNQTQTDKLENIQVSSNDEKLMERVMKVINKNLSNSDITVEMIAKEIGISRVHLHRKLKEITNQSTRDFIRNIRLQAAAKLLREKKLTVAEVSDLTGFKQPNNFSTVFKEMYGMSPTAYAAKYHQSAAETGEDQAQ